MLWKAWDIGWNINDIHTIVSGLRTCPRSAPPPPPSPSTPRSLATSRSRSGPGSCSCRSSGNLEHRHWWRIGGYLINLQYSLGVLISRCEPRYWIRLTEAGWPSTAWIGKHSEQFQSSPATEILRGTLIGLMPWLQTGTSHSHLSQGTILALVPTQTT